MLDNKNRSYYLFGDSITFGQLVSPHLTWSTQLSAAISASPNLHNEFVVQNVGVNGNTTRQALERLHFDILSHKPTYCSIQFGMNDCNRWHSDNGVQRVPPRSFKHNLLEILDKCFASEVEHCFLHTNHPSLKLQNGLDNYDYNADNLRYNELIRSVASQAVSIYNDKVSLIDIEEKFNFVLYKNSKISLSDLLLQDGIHLSALGHHLYFEEVFKVFDNTVLAGCR